MYKIWEKSENSEEYEHIDSIFKNSNLPIFNLKCELHKKVNELNANI